MPIYTYGCEGCGNATDLIRPIASKDDPVECLNGCGPMKSLIAVPAGLIGRAVAPGAVPPSEVPGADTSGGRAFPHVITNLRANNNDGAAVAIEGPFRVKVDGATMTNTREGFRLSDGAMVEASNIRYSAGKHDGGGEGEPKKPRAAWKRRWR